MPFRVIAFIRIPPDTEIAPDHNLVADAMDERTQMELLQPDHIYVIEDDEENVIVGQYGAVVDPKPKLGD